MTFLQELDHGEEGRRQSGQSRQGHEEVPGGRGGGRPRQHSHGGRRRCGRAPKARHAGRQSWSSSRPERRWGTRGQLGDASRRGGRVFGQRWPAGGRTELGRGGPTRAGRRVAELGSELDQGRAGKDGSERRSGKRSWQTGPAAAGREASTGCGGGASVGTGAREGGHAGGGAQPAWEGSDMREERIAGRSRRTCGRAEVGTRGWSQPQERRAGRAPARERGGASDRRGRRTCGQAEVGTRPHDREGGPVARGAELEGPAPTEIAETGAATARTRSRGGGADATQHASGRSAPSRSQRARR
ncbi:hypothetical protein ZWY2020_056508 [Hordeum vulgare]|nr:hypothetical protein ZWY2020_056508 [Hordeum vulgare]